jgi:hypothetical protein
MFYIQINYDMSSMIIYLEFLFANLSILIYYVNTKYYNINTNILIKK